MEMFSTFFNLLLVILGFGLLIFVHELGHFLAARWAGIRAEAFAVGMGPVMGAWRRGIGFRPKSTWPDYMRRMHEYLGDELAPNEEPSPEQRDRAEKALGIGETEYSLRWLPIGGFVKMLGQEDANPNAVSDDPRSYNRCPIGKRMVVVSAGVIMNLILAAILFIIAFLVGVQFEAPVIGDVDPTAPAGQAVAQNAEALGITQPGLQSGDRVLEIDGSEANTFADIQIASAMGRPDREIEFKVEREGYDEPLIFRMTPERDQRARLLSVGLYPAFSATLDPRDRNNMIDPTLEALRLDEAGVESGMTLTHVNGNRVRTFQQILAEAEASEGEPLRTVWQHHDRRGEPVGSPVEAMLELQPVLPAQRYADAGEMDQNFESGLLGFVPLVRITMIPEGSPNRGILKPDDAVFRAGDLHAPRSRDFLRKIQGTEVGELDLVVIRNGEESAVTARIVRRGFFDGAGMLNVSVGTSHHVPYTAAPMERIALPRESPDDEVQTYTPAAAALDLLPGTRLLRVNDHPIENWADFRRALLEVTQEAQADERSAEVRIEVQHPTPGRERETVTMAISANEVAHLHRTAQSWSVNLSPVVFEPLYATRTANGNPLRAVWMGVEETHKILMLTYLTIDRLFRRTVGVDQLRGPVGIVDIGVRIADRGIMYLIFLLAMISVNLAVINFLPLPIVDGGLFLFLIYEKITGRPPSIGFQNAVTILGLALIGTLFVVVTYHDIARLFTGG
ncbi:MAG: hypothetical protein EA377_01800 [Phycisphaerales bacterium]|nr:MAG: hypothetical protein EA377_01800 [Phycisphaerales bacterium]